MDAPPNRLIHETSPYLLQHAHNPVRWQPWDEEALAAARNEDKPILLSIGYSACHWCHVMAHESFEDAATAELMNERFVNIKVDREERPDLDKIYQTAHQLMNRRGGGWPLTVFLAPDDLAPFFAGTYFPRESRQGLADFKTVLDKVADYYAEHRGEIRAHAGALADTLARLRARPPAAGEEPDREIIDRAQRALLEHYDARHGGFGGAPKFPRTGALELLLKVDDPVAHDRALHTLASMADGGLFDQLGGGFCRYAVDAAWRIPHFEKMLYDNGALLRLYAIAARSTGSPRLREVATLTAEWLISVMQSDEGGYYASLDADSEGQEGKYYVWTMDELRVALTGEEYALAELRFGLDGEPNFEGRWHLNIAADVAELADRRNESPESVVAQLETIRQKLLQTRVERVPPARDEKTLTAWNGLAIRGMAAAGALLGEPRWLDSATRALDFVRERMWRDGHLCAVYKDGRARFNAYLDDYAFMAAACLEVLQARWRTADLEFARALCEAMLAHFEDREGGGFWFTSDDHEALLDRPKSFADESMAAGNGVAAQALVKLGHLLGDIRYLDAAARTFRAGAAALADYPDAMCSLLLALRDELDFPAQIILRGEPAVLTDWRARIEADFRHSQRGRRRVYAIPHNVGDLPGLLGVCKSRADGVAYFCKGTECSRPMESIDELLAEMTG
ncbi:MAG TPA: thioredoxin domain-containing protein [Gammaproteobacteria bacterium]|nr:thioredoxin domain-containing protein [Gammaproteobacteria bacterium]